VGGSGQLATAGGQDFAWSAKYLFKMRPPGRRLVAFLCAALVASLSPAGAARSAADTQPPAAGFWLVASDGGIFSFGDAPFHGSTGAMRLNQPIVGMAPTTTGEGYWLVATDGGIFSFGDAPFHGSTGAMRLNKPIVGMAPTASGAGYWLVATDGGIFSFGDAPFHGSTGAMRLNRPILGMAPTPSGKGYWLVASDGGVFSFGDARFFGSAAEKGDPTRRVVAMTPTPSGKGYWQATSSGEVLAFGDAPGLGSAGTVKSPVMGMVATASGGGYWLTGADGSIYSFGDAQSFGSTPLRLNRPIVGLGARPASVSVVGPNPSPSSDFEPAVEPSGSGPEQIGPPMESPNGGAHTEDIPATGNDCGFPEPPRKTALPDQTEYIGEASGMAGSTKHPGVYWVVRDSGHTAAVNAVRIDDDGLVESREILVDGAVNGDWEEINYSVGPDGRGRLWVVDNGGDIANYKIYEILEPDPDTATRAEILNAYDWSYPDLHRYNTEASFMARGYLVLVTKRSPHAKLYRFDSLSTATTNVPTYIGELGNSKDVSMVRQSPDGKLLVTSSHTIVHLYRSTDGSGSLRSFMGRLPDCEMKAFPDEHVESGEFSANREIVFLDELKATYRLRLAD
jgi:hypothetical protein